MAIQGTLEDLGVLDVIQFAHRCRQSGALTLARPDEEARLYYEQGRLIHAEIGPLEGIEALVHLTGWREGEFAFRSGGDSPSPTIDMEVTQAIMKALQIADERRQEAARQPDPEPPAAVRDPREVLRERLREALDRHPALRQAAILSEAGQWILVESAEAANGRILAALRQPLSVFLAGYPEPGLSRAFFESLDARIAVAGVGAALYVVLRAHCTVSLGALSMALSRLVSQLQESAFDWDALSRPENGDLSTANEWEAPELARPG